MKEIKSQLPHTLNEFSASLGSWKIVNICLLADGLLMKENVQNIPVSPWKYVVVEYRRDRQLSPPTKISKFYDIEGAIFVIFQTLKTPILY